MEETWRQWKRNPFSRYNRNPFLKKIEKEKNNYKGGIVKEWNKKEAVLCSIQGLMSIYE